MVTNTGRTTKPVTNGASRRSNATRPGRGLLRRENVATTTVESLHKAVNLVLVARRFSTPDGVLDTPRLWPWATYKELLEAAEAKPIDILLLRDLWFRINAEFPIGQPLVIPEDELVADTVPEFLQLLNTLCDRAMLGKSELARLSGVCRQQLYNILNVERGVLPTKGQQVEAIARACGLSRGQIAAVSALWLKLERVRRRDAPPPPAWMQPYLDKLAEALARPDLDAAEVDDAMRVARDSMAEERRYVDARQVVQTFLRGLDEHGMPEVSFAKLAPVIVGVLKKACPEEDVAELVFEAGFLFGQENAERSKMLFGSRVVR